MTFKERTAVALLVADLGARFRAGAGGDETLGSRYDAALQTAEEFAVFMCARWGHVDVVDDNSKLANARVCKRCGGKS